VHRVRERVGIPELGTASPEFTAAMDDDLGTPGALAAIHGAVREGNIALDGGHRAAAQTAAGSVRAMTSLLGLDPLDPRWVEGDRSADTATGALSALVEDLLVQRQEARARRDFAAADEVRNRLTAAGISVEDSPDGPTWSLKDG
jgi:cysteinyl-tRNA synthetase